MKQQPLKAIVSRFSIILVIVGLIIGLISTANAETAKEIFRNAYENRYTWDTPFPGYVADVTTTTLEKTASGKVQINPDLSVVVTGIEDEELRQLSEDTLKMETIHRRRLAFDKLHGNKDFELESTDENGTVVIREVEDEQNSFYRVKNKTIVQVNRNFGEVAVTVDTLKTTNTPQGYLANEFQTTFRDTQTGEVVSIENIRDVHQNIGSYYLLSSREIRQTTQGNPAEKEKYDFLIEFSQFKLL